MIDVSDLLSVRRALHQIPETGFEEHETQAVLLQLISQLPQAHLTVTKWRTGIFVLVSGSSPQCRVAYRTDIDGLPVAEDTGVAYASKHSGMMHACGHDVHMTIALGLLSHFATRQPEDDMLFIFQPAEEGPGGAQPILESDAFAEVRPDVIFALHVNPELPVGTIGVRPGILFANTSELFVNLIGTGGHAAFPHRANDMVVAGAHTITALQSVVSRNINPLDSAVITIGCLNGGTKQNIIADRARLEGTIRTLSGETMELVKERVEHILDGVSRMFECRYELDYGANYYRVFNHERLTTDFMRFVTQASLAIVEEVPVAMTGEDFGYFLREIPGFLFWLGVDTPYGLHHSKMLPREESIHAALKILIPFFERSAYRKSLSS